MDYSEALSFTFRDEEWLKKIAIGGLIGFISFYAGLFFIFGFFLVGYYIGVLRKVSKEEEQPLPEWSDMSKIFVDGLMGTIIMLVYFLIIGGICAALIVQLVNDPFMEDFERVLAIVLISVATLLTLMVFVNFGLLQFARTENFASAFSVSDLFKLIKSHLGNFLAISIFSLILNLILLCAGLGILSPFTNFWGLVIQAHLFGQCAREMQLNEPAMQSA